MVRIDERPLTHDERLQLTERVTETRQHARTALLRSGAASVIVCGVLMALTLAAADAPPWVIVLFWTVLAVVFSLWTGWSTRAHFHRQAGWLESGLAANRARATRISTTRVVEFEEAEDEGACWAFDAGDGRSVFVTGQDFYADDSFPNSDFTLTAVLSPNGLAVEVFTTMTGQRIAPERTVTSATRLRMEPPQHLEIVDVPIDAIGR